MKTWFAYAMAASVMLWLCEAANAQTPRYALRQRKHEDNTTTLVLYDRYRRASLWKCTLDVYPPHFSLDHRALAMEVRGKHIPVWGLLIWREGEPARLFYKQSFFKDNDGILDMAWSADKQRLLLRTWAGEGMFDFDYGEIWSMNIPLQTFGFGVRHVRRMRWIGRRRVQYWKVALVGRPPHPTERISHIWSCP